MSRTSVRVLLGMAVMNIKDKMIRLPYDSRE